MITISRDEARTLVAVIDYSESLERLLRATHESLKDAGLIDTIPMPPHPEAAAIVHELRDRLADRPPDLGRHYRDLVLRIISQYGDTGRTEQIEELLAEIPIDTQATLDGLLEDGLVRQLKDGHNTVTWELTPAGEAQL